MTNGYAGMFDEIAFSLNITRGTDEPEENWIERVIYSAAGRAALYSLYDHLEDEESVSITHFKNRAKREIMALCAAGHITSITDEAGQICDEIYEEYVSTGYLYHLKGPVEAVPDIAASGKLVKFVRGAVFNNRTKASGLGCYFLPSDKEDDRLSTHMPCTDFYQMFHINRMQLDSYYRALIRRSTWRPFNGSDDIEFLRMNGSFTKGGYWCQKPLKDGTVSLLREGRQGKKQYYLYKYEDNRIYISVLPDWLTEKKEYRQIANCILFHRGTLPASVVHMGENLVQLHVGYLYPPPIQNVIMLYSWPEFLNDMTKFHRVMNRQVWESIRAALEPLGYKFKEDF